MKNWIKGIFLLLFVFSATAENRSVDAETLIQSKEIKKMLSKMSLEEKVGEMTQLSIDVLSVGEPYNLAKPHQFDKERLQKVLVDLNVGSILNCGGHAYTKDYWNEIVETIQDYAVNRKKNGIPIIYGIDAIHGTNYTQHSTLFPQQLGLASTWNTDLAKQQAQVTAYETRASSIPWTFAPVLDIGRDARWPRLWETFGEDVHLASEMGASMVDGFQGEDPSSPYNIAACMKHFLGYSVTLRGKDRVPAWIPERQLREYFMPSFQAAIDAGAKTIMICSGEMNGIPVHADKWVLQDLLRDEMGFEGIALTDWEDIGYLVSRHRVAKDMKDAIALAINAGIDMAMVPMDINFPIQLKELVEEGRVSQARIDEAVARILALKMDLGLFDTPFHAFDQYPDFGSEKHRQIALAAANESVILLKNQENILPLTKQQKIMVCGPNADMLSVLNGGWTGTWQGSDPEWDTPNKPTILSHLNSKLGAAQISYADSIDQVSSKSATADVILACLGEMPYTEKPGDIDDINLDQSQIDLIKACKETGKPIVLLLTQGRPRIVSEIVDDVDGIVLAFLPGNEGAEAIANVLFGDVNPSGKLPITYPKYANDLITYDHKGTDLVHRDFSMNGFNPQWEFGYGLSYTNFQYSNLKLGAVTGTEINVSVDVLNAGGRSGKEVVQLFVSDLVASITPSVKRLRAFDKIELEAGATHTVEFTIDKKDLSFIGIDNEWIFEPGEFEFQIADLKEKIEIE